MRKSLSSTGRYVVEDGEGIRDYRTKVEIRGDRPRVGAPETPDRKNGKSIERK